MNTESQSQYDQQPPASPPPSGTGTGFFAWLRGLGVERSQDERWFAGVAGGIAARAGIDPLIVRGIFVVLAILGGPGVLIYLAGWLLLPDRAGQIHTEELLRGRASAGVITGVVLIGLWFLSRLTLGIGVFALPWREWSGLGGWWWFGSALTWAFWIAVFAGIAFLIHRLVLSHGENQRQGGHGVPPTEDSTTDSFVPPTAFAQSTSRTEQWSEDWTVQYAARHEKRRPGSAHVLITAALTLIAAGLGALWAELGGLGAATTRLPTLVAALVAATAVLAISMIVAGLRGKNSGAIGVFGFLAASALAAAALLPAGTTYLALGSNTLTDAAPASFSVIGDTNLDLSIYDSEPDRTHVDITQVAGEVNLVLSDVRPTEISMDVAAGSIEARGLDWREHSGILNHRTVTINQDAEGPTLHVTVRVLAGTINVIKTD